MPVMAGSISTESTRSRDSYTYSLGAIFSVPKGVDKYRRDGLTGQVAGVTATASVLAAAKAVPTTSLEKFTGMVKTLFTSKTCAEPPKVGRNKKQVICDYCKRY